MISDTDLPTQPDTLQQQALRSFKTLKLLALLISVFLIAFVAGTVGYLLGIRTNQNAPQSTRKVSLQPAPKIFPSPTLGLVISPLLIPEVHWITYTDETLGATFEHPSKWSLTHAHSDNSVTGKGTDYKLVFIDSTKPKNTMSIYISAINYPENISLADFYRRYAPDGAERFKNISFQETVNPHGIKFGRIVQPFTNPDTLETVHNGREYEITKAFSLSPDYMQEAIAEYNHLVDSFTFIDEAKNSSKSPI